MVLCERIVLSAKELQRSAELVQVCGCVRSGGLMHSAGVSVVLCPVCCVAPAAKEVLAADSTDPHLQQKIVPRFLEDTCRKRLNIWLKSRCLEAAGGINRDPHPPWNATEDTYVEHAQGRTS